MVSVRRAGYEPSMRARRSSTTTPALFTAVLAFCVAIPSTAMADPIVVVHVRRHGSQPADATVVLRDADGVVGTCRTVESTCEIRGVPPGLHTVSAQDDQGNETPGRPVMIPPDGRVSLFVAVP